MASRPNRPSEQVIFEAVTIARNPLFRTDEGWGGFTPTDQEVAEQATHQAIMAAIHRGDAISGPDWRTSFTETPQIVMRILETM